jgi:hypothetical protein
MVEPSTVFPKRAPAALTPNCEFIEFLPSDLSESGRARTLTSEEVIMVDIKTS